MLPCTTDAVLIHANKKHLPQGSRVTCHVGVQVDVIGVYVVLHDVLVNPTYLRSPNEIDGETK